MTPAEALFNGLLANYPDYEDPDEYDLADLEALVGVAIKFAPSVMNSIHVLSAWIDDIYEDEDGLSLWRVRELCRTEKRFLEIMRR